jgi:outer membrane receptor protein involved in Fe transport
MRTRRLSVSVGLAAVLTAALATAQITGTIEGVVLEERGRALPRVTVEATSSALQGTKVALTDEGGRFRLVFLPPGVYSVRCTLAGFSDVEQGGVLVGLGRTVTLHVQMRSAFREAITVTGAPPAIDVSSAEVGANLTSGFFLTLPMQRDYASIAQAAPGTTTDGSGVRTGPCRCATSGKASGLVVFGSTGLDDAYFIDGINTNDVYTNSVGKSLNFEFIQEVQVKTGGYQAEFGRSTGGVVNVITKSGGNVFHGDAFGYHFSDALQSRWKQAAETYRQLYSSTFLVEAFRKSDVGADVGGFLLKDKLWFFAAYDRVSNNQDQKVTKDFSPFGGPPEGKVYVASETKQLWSAKFTWRPGANHSLVVSAFGDPERNEGSLPGYELNGEESTFLGTFDTGGSDAMVHYQGVLGAHAVVDAQASHHSMNYTTSGAGSSTPRVSDRTTSLFAATGVPFMRGGIGYYGDEQDTRDGVRIGATFFFGRFAGEHEIKAGAESERVFLDDRYTYSGGQSVLLLCAGGQLTPDGCPPEWSYYRHDFLLAEVPPGGALDPSIATYAAPFARIDPSNRNDAAFLQDTWRVSPRLTLNLGVRLERQKMYDRHGTLKLTLNDEWAPRLGFVWDLRGDGASRVFGSWGRFYETVPMTIPHYAFQDLIEAWTSNRDLTSVACNPAFDADPAYRQCSIYVGSAAPVDPAGVKGEFMDEAVLGTEVTAARDLVLGAKLIYRNLGRVVEDSVTADGYYIGNPGYGLLKSAVDLSWSWLLPVPQPKRTFKGVELTAIKRMSNNWQMIASYLWSKLEGNYDGNYLGDYNQSTPNLSEAYDYAELTIHNDGYLANDHRHQVKVAGAYSFPFGLTVGASAYYRTGAPLSALVPVYGYGYATYLSQRGAWGRTEAEYEADLHLGYPIKIGGAEVNLLLDVFHLLDRQGETGRNQNYTYIDQPLSVFDYSTGKPLPPIAPGTPCTSLVPPELAYSCNPGFNKSNAWQDPRSVRLGVRITF